MLPPLHAFKVFEVVARLGHVGAAAAELHVTPGAVSQQLRSLQLHLGVELFTKTGRRLMLTEAGLGLRQSVGAAMAEIGEGVRNLTAQRIDSQAEVVVNICIPPVLGTTWLAPRLFAFMADHRHVRLQVSSGVEFHAIDWRRTDVAIVYGNPPWPGFWWRMLHGVYLMPVCSPQLLRGPHAIRQPADVLHHRLLHEDDGSEWRRWLAQARVKYPGAADIYFGDFALILQAARDGHGVALVDDVISARDLDEGRLVQPLTQRVPAAKNYHCICSEENLAKPEIGALVDWLIDQASRAPAPRIGLG